MRGALRSALREGPVPLPPGCLQHAAQSPGLPAGPPGKAAPGVIKEKGTGTLKKMFIDDIDSIELLAGPRPAEGLANVAVPVFVFIAMFFVDWKLALLSLCSLPLGLAAMGAMYRAGTSKVGDYYASARKMNQPHCGVHQRHGGGKGLQPGRGLLPAL